MALAVPLILQADLWQWWSLPLSAIINDHLLLPSGESRAAKAVVPFPSGRSLRLQNLLSRGKHKIPQEMFPETEKAAPEQEAALVPGGEQALGWAAAAGAAQAEDRGQPRAPPDEHV